jgi:hypothetical protein
MTNQEQNAENVYQEGSKYNKDSQHATQIADKATDELQEVAEGAQEGDVGDIALEDAEELI